MTLQEAAQAALDVQNACNTSGVVHTFVQAMSALLVEANRIGGGTYWANQHPIAKLFVFKLADLAGMHGCTAGNSLPYVLAIADGKDKLPDGTPVHSF